MSEPHASDVPVGRCNPTQQITTTTTLKLSGRSVVRCCAPREHQSGRGAHRACCASLSPATSCESSQINASGSLSQSLLRHRRARQRRQQKKRRGEQRRLEERAQRNTTDVSPKEGSEFWKCHRSIEPRSTSGISGGCSQPTVRSPERLHRRPMGQGLVAKGKAPQNAAICEGCSVAAVPFGSPDPDPDSDVIALVSLRTYRLACLQCCLSDQERTETETMAAMLDHFDAHRAAGHRVPDSFYEGVMEWIGIDDDIRTVYAWSGREEDGNLSVSRKRPGDSLCCLSCVLNEMNMVECYSTDQMIEHLDEHRSWGLFVADHVYEGLERDRSDNNRVTESFFASAALNRPRLPNGSRAAFFPSSRRIGHATERSVIFPRRWSLRYVALSSLLPIQSFPQGGPRRTVHRLSKNFVTYCGKSKGRSKTRASTFDL